MRAFFIANILINFVSMKWLLILIILCSTLFTHAINIDSLEHELKVSQIDSVKFRILSKIIKNKLETSPSEAEEYALIQLEQATTTKEKALANLHLGLTYDYQYKFENGINSYREALKLFKKQNDSIGVSRALLNLGIINYYKGDLDSSIFYYVKTLDIAEAIGNERIVSSALGNLGVLHRDLGEFEMALKYEFKSLEIDVKSNDEEGIARGYNNIGLCYRGLNDFDNALSYYSKSLKLRKKNNDLSGLAVVLTNIGQVYYHMKDFKNALKYNLQSLEYEKEIGNDLGVAESNINIGECYLELDQLEKSIKCLESALKTADSIGVPEVVLAALEGLSASYAKTGMYDKAYFINMRYSSLQDSLFNESRMKQIKELEAKYNTTRAEKENELLKKENTINLLQIKQKNSLERNLYIGIILMMLILVLVVYAYNSNRKSNKKLAIRNHRIELMNRELEFKNKSITDSIVYAKRIQEAILPQDKLVKQYLQNSFILYKPKDIVSGDFYWMEQIDQEILFAAVDCTGHGVPGAFMSIVGNNGLNRAVRETKIKEPSLILDLLNEYVTSSVQQQKTLVKDGMDIALCNLNTETNILKFSGANNPLYLVREGELHIYKGMKQAIGDSRANYDQIELQLVQGDLCYIFTDGYADQFGGDKDKKFNLKRFKKTILDIHSFSMEYQREELERIFIEWKGNEEQLDDICVIGFKI